MEKTLINGEEFDIVKQIDAIINPPLVNQHKYELLDGGSRAYPASHFKPGGKYEPSKLDVRLTELKKKGVKVLGFRRQGQQFVIKTMAPI